MSVRIEQAAGTRKKILEAAVEILSIDGSDSLTSGKLSAKLGMSKGTIFHHFEDMAGVQIGVLEYLVAALDEQIQKRNHRNLRSLVNDLIDTTFDSINQYRNVYAALFHFISNAVHNSAFQQRLRERADHMLNAWKQMLFEHVDRKIPEAEKDRIVRMIDMYFSGLLVHDFIYADPKRYKRITKDFMEIVVQLIE